MTLSEILSNGNVPTFDEINIPFQGAKWHLRMGAFGSIPDAIVTHQLLLGDAWTWHINYDNSASVVFKNNHRRAFDVVSTCPGHALTLATVQAWESER